MTTLPAAIEASRLTAMHLTELTAAELTWQRREGLERLIYDQSEITKELVDMHNADLSMNTLAAIAEAAMNKP